MYECECTLTNEDFLAFYFGGIIYFDRCPNAMKQKPNKAEYVTACERLICTLCYQSILKYNSICCGCKQKIDETHVRKLDAYTDANTNEHV